MKIKKIIWQHRRDFSAEMECESCGHIQHLDRGYDDDYYHSQVIPSMQCNSCGIANGVASSTPTVPFGVVL